MKYIYTIILLINILFNNSYSQTNINNYININSDSVKSVIEQNKRILDSFTALKNKNEILPLLNLENLNIVSISVSDSITSFQKMLENYTKIHSVHINQLDTSFNFKKLNNYNLVIYNQLDKPNIELQNSISNFLKSKSTITCLYQDRLEVSSSIIESSEVILHSNKSTKLYQEILAQKLMGAFDFNGKLEANYYFYFKEGDGISVSGVNRLSYNLPYNVGVNYKFLSNKIDSLVTSSLKNQEFPGCQILVMKSNNILFRKSYGYHRFYKDKKVKNTDLYDLASLTKILGPLPIIMKLCGDKKINVNEKFSHYWKDFKKSNKSEITLRQALSHSGGFKPWIPFWKMTKNKQGYFNRKYVRVQPSNKFSIKLTENLFLNKKFKSQIFKAIKESELVDKDYQYSDLPFIIFPTMLEKIIKSNYEEYLYSKFYKKLGVQNMVYNPIEKGLLSRVIPTENDQYFRNTQVLGLVHDESAALMNGVSGNAGLFGNTNDIAKIIQMYLNKGEYALKRYLKKEVVEEFTCVQFPDLKNRRALGFDKPLVRSTENEYYISYPSEKVSNFSYGHTGFTGGIIWIDPVYDLAVIFLTNRIYPTRSNSKFLKTSIRTKILNEVYNSIFINVNNYDVVVKKQFKNLN